MKPSRRIAVSGVITVSTTKCMRPMRSNCAAQSAQNIKIRTINVVARGRLWREFGARSSISHSAHSLVCRHEGKHEGQYIP
jgi:hypothetical protein